MWKIIEIKLADGPPYSGPICAMVGVPQGMYYENEELCEKHLRILNNNPFVNKKFKKVSTMPQPANKRASRPKDARPR